MKRTRFLLILVLAFVMAASLFAVACEKNDSSENKDKDSTSITASDDTGSEDTGSDTGSEDTGSDTGSEDTGSQPEEKVIVTFNANGGTLNSESSYEPNEYGEIEDDVDDPTRDGYSFEGWYTAAEGGDAMDPYFDYFEESITLYAHWAKVSTITFDAGIGTLAGNSTMQLADGQSITEFPSCTIESEFWMFDGWMDEDEEMVGSSYTVNGDATLYAHYDIIEMPLYNLKDSAGEAQIGYRIEAEDAKVVGTPNQEGHEDFLEVDQQYASGQKSLGFLGVAGNKVLFTFKSATAGTATLIVRMSSNAYTYTQSGGSWTIYVTDQVINADAFTATFNGVDAQCEAATLRGAGPEYPMTWNMYFDPVSFGELNVVEGVNTLIITGSGANFPNTDCLDIITDLELTSAKGEAATGSINQEKLPEEVTVTFNANGGTLTGNAEVSVMEGKTITGAPTANMEGSSFVGWFTAAEGGDQINLSTYKVDGEITLYAHWVTAYTVTFDANGGTLTGNASVSIGEGNLITGAPTASKPGNNFVGWFTAAEDGDQINLTTYTVSGAVTLYAHYELIPAFSMPVAAIEGGYRLEAENADVAGVPQPSWWNWAHPNEPFTVVETDKPNASGTQAIGSLNSAGATIKFTFNAATAGKATLKLYMASNASSGTGATEFSTSIFTATCNGAALNYEAQTVQGGTTYSDVFEAVILGEVDLVEGYNEIIITVVNANSMGNMDCLDIITEVAITSVVA